jgi:hypothetical protein
VWVLAAPAPAMATLTVNRVRAALRAMLGTDLL